MNNRQRVLRLGAVAALLVVLATACGGASAQQAQPTSIASPSAGMAPPSTQPAGGTGASSNGSAGSTSNDGASAGGGSSNPVASVGLTPLQLPWKPKVPVRATVTPACVLPGGGATLTVTTKPRAGVGYQAVYWGNKGGGAPPFGAGLGGNDKGFTDPLGNFTSSWTVSPRAPAGPARVDVIVGWNHKWGYADPSFAVADDSGTCS